MTIETRKFLAPIDVTRPERQISGFLIPDRSGKFIEIASGKQFEAGLVVYVGKPITAETVYERAVSCGRNVSLEDVERLIGLITKFKVRDVVATATDPDFRLVKLKVERIRSSKLPK